MNDGDPCPLVEDGHLAEGGLHGAGLLPREDEGEGLGAAVAEVEAGQQAVQQAAAGGQLQPGEGGDGPGPARHVDMDPVRVDIGAHRLNIDNTYKDRYRNIDTDTFF